MANQFRSPTTCSTSRARNKAIASLIALLTAAAFASTLAGCAKPLLSPDEPRSQFDRSDRLRGRSAPPYVTNEFGERKPNVRGRLLGGD